MLILRAILSGAILAFAFGPAAAATSLDNARKFCAVLDASGVLAAKCAVSSWASTVGVLVNANEAEAKQFCGLAADMAGQNGLAFEPQWRIEVHSPRGGNKALAVCHFAQAPRAAESFGLRPQIGE